MHLVFYLYGQKERVDRLIHWLETSMWPLKYTPEGMPEQTTMAQGHMRYGMMGSWEFIFPESYKDLMMNYLNFDRKIRSDKKLGQGMKIAALRKALKCEKIPEFKKDLLPAHLPKGLTDFISIVPIGVRYDDFRLVDGEPGQPKNMQEAL